MSEGTFAGTRGNDDNAPTPDLRATAPERGGSTHFGPPPSVCLCDIESRP